MAAGYNESQLIASAEGDNMRTAGGAQDRRIHDT